MKLFKLLSLLFCVIAFLILRPLPEATEKNIDFVQGEVASIENAGSLDIVFLLKNSNTKYYIHRGVELGYSLSELREDLLGKTVEIAYPKSWSPLNSVAKLKHLSRLKLGPYTIFDEVATQASS